MLSERACSREFCMARLLRVKAIAPTTEIDVSRFQAGLYLCGVGNDVLIMGRIKTGDHY
jgi:hypothetical protein